MTVINDVGIPGSVAPRGTLPRSEMKNQLSIGFLNAIAAHAGVEFWTSSSDFNGVDATLRTYAKYERRAGATLDVQLKCTSQTAVQKDDHIAWQLNRNSYVKLSDPDRFSLGVLAVLVVPGEVGDWLDQDEDRLLSKSCMYFSAANAWDPIANGAESKVVKCPRTNILNVDTLLDLMQVSSTMGF
jgi:hypothetical protein